MIGSQTLNGSNDRPEKWPTLCQKRLNGPCHPGHSSV